MPPLHSPSLTCGPLPQRAHHHSQLGHRYRAIFVLVEQHESLLELGHLVFRQAVLGLEQLGYVIGGHLSFTPTHGRLDDV